MADMGCSQILPSHQTYMLVFLIVILLSTVHADCPVNKPCVCRRTNLICDNIDNVYNVPSFDSSNVTYASLILRNMPGLTTLQNNAFSGLKVKTIELNNLGLSKIEPKAFSGLDDTLETLKIMYIHLESLADYVFNPVKNSLKELYLDKNNVTTLSPTLFSHLKQLQKLSLNKNKLRSLSPTLFSQLTELKFLSLTYNKLTRLSSTLFSHLAQLTNLYLCYNDLETISDDAFSHLTQLQTLALHNNKLTTLSPTLFIHLTKLRTLSLNHNNLTRLSSTLFSNLTQLTRLYLHYNQLETIAHGTFSNLTKLEMLRIHANKLTTLDSHLFSNLNDLRELKIAANPFNCDCRLDWVRDFRLSKLIDDTAVCFNPPNLKNVDILSYTTSPCPPPTSAVITTLPTTASPTTTITVTTTLPTTSLSTTPVLPQETFNTTTIAFLTLSGVLFLVMFSIVIVTTVRWYLVSANRPKSSDDENRYDENQPYTTTLPFAVVGDEIGEPSQNTTGHENLGLAMEHDEQRTQE